MAAGRYSSSVTLCPSCNKLGSTQQCLTAINLDGGGSTTMWIERQGVVNTPSDIFGERKVANALLVKLKTTNQK